MGVFFYSIFSVGVIFSFIFKSNISVKMRVCIGVLFSICKDFVLRGTEKYYLAVVTYLGGLASFGT